MVLGDSVNAYLAARAAFLLVKHHPVREKIESLALPGLGTGVGQLGPNTCARQVRAAIDDVLLDRYRPPRSWQMRANAISGCTRIRHAGCIGETKAAHS